MTDRDTTIGMLKKELIDLCFLKGWGVNGIQDPRPVSAAMMVEVMELLEHFDTDDFSAEDLPDAERAEIAEEIADVMAYMLQLMYALRFDVSASLLEGASDAVTPVQELKRSAACEDRISPVRQAVRMAVKARFVLRNVQWLSDAETQAFLAGDMPKKAAATGTAFAGQFVEILRLTEMLGIDLSAAVLAKIEKNKTRVWKTEPME